LKPDYQKYKEAGDAAKQIGSSESALENYKSAIAIRPQYSAAHFEIGDTLARQGKHLEAIAAYSASWVFSCFQLDEAGLMIGRLFVLKNMAFDATRIFEKINIDKFDALSKLYFAEALRLEDRIEEAVKFIPELEALEDPLAHRVLGALYLEIDKLELAEYHLKKASRFDPDGFVTDKKIGLYYRLKDLSSLRVTLEVAIKNFPQNDFYIAQAIAVDNFLDVNSESPKIKLKDHQHILDALNYFLPHIKMGTKVLGTTYEVLTYASKQIVQNGIGLEFGVRNGNTINILARALPSITLYGFDSFEGIPESWNGEPQFSYSTAGRIPNVEPNVILIKGWFEDTLKNFMLDRPISIVNIDCDLYSSTLTIFKYIGRFISAGTIIIFDEYIGNQTWMHDEFKAFQEFVQSHGVSYEYLAVSFYSKQCVIRIIKIGSDPSFNNRG